jgi:hypothetical protein
LICLLGGYHYENAGKIGLYGEYDYVEKSDRIA